MHRTIQWTNESAFWPSDPASGAGIMQLTGDVGIATNIYCEDPTCSPGNRIAIFRSLHCDASASAELWVGDLENGLCARLDTGATWVGAFARAYGEVLYYPRLVDDHWEIRRLTFSTLEIDVVHRFPSGMLPHRTLGSASPDGRLLANGRLRPDGWYEAFVLDLETGSEHILAAGEDFCNPHPRFDRQAGEWVLVQQNRGWRYDPASGNPALADPTLGATLVLCRSDGSELRELPVARPAIPPGISGHESWLKGQPAFIYSTAPMDPPFDDGQRVGNLLRYRVGDARPSVVADAPDIYFGHVSSSACGRFWCCDGWHWPHDGQDCCRVAPRIFVGSLHTGKYAALCDVGGAWPRYENGHAHPYLSADNRHAIFTSTRAGFPQVFRATLPAGLLEELES